MGGERSLVRLAGAMQVTKGAMTNTVGRLLAKGWVEVRADPRDGRGKLVAITPAGTAARNGAIMRLMGGLEGLGEMVEADGAALLAALRQIRAWLDANR